MSLSAMLFGQNSAIHKVTNIMGLGIPGLLHKAFMPGNPKMAPQTLGELSSQSAKEGDPRPIVYGIGRPIGGNVMYMSQPIRKMVKTYVGKAGGKGGGKKKKQYQDVEHVYRYYAIRVCEGPISGFRRIWRNGALVYDGRKGSDWGAKNNHLFFETYRLYTGSWNQMPDSVLQARQGMDIPAYRGTAYLVANNEDLTDFGGAIPQWQFEVVRSEGFYLTSRPYALESTDSLSVGMLRPSVARRSILKEITIGTDSLTVGMLQPSVKRITAVRYLTYDNGETDSLAVGMLQPSVKRTTAVRYLTYDDGETDSLAVGMLQPSVKRVVSAAYLDYEIDTDSLTVGMLQPSVKRTSI